MTLKLHRTALLALPLVIAATAMPAAASQFPTARQVAMHEGRLDASSTSQLPTARQVAMHEGRLQASSTSQFPTARQVAMHEGRLTPPVTPSAEARGGSNAGFHWGDAGIGAGGAVALITALVGGAFLVSRRHRGVRRATAG
jgi:hypothetical protein